MIIDIFILLGSAVLETLGALLNALNYVPPIAALFSSVSYILSFTAYFYGVLDVPRFYTDLAICLGFEAFWYGFISIWWVIGFFRTLFSVGGTSGH